MRGGSCGRQPAATKPPFYSAFSKFDTASIGVVCVVKNKNKQALGTASNGAYSVRPSQCLGHRASASTGKTAIMCICKQLAKLYTSTGAYLVHRIWNAVVPRGSTVLLGTSFAFRRPLCRLQVLYCEPTVGTQPRKYTVSSSVGHKHGIAEAVMPTSSTANLRAHQYCTV